MTRGQRARTALLLRCAADIAASGDYVLGPDFEAAPRLGVGKRECDLATMAAKRVARKTGRSAVEAFRDEYIATVLEAAAILEEGSWP
jgi:hypothetical protein